MTDEQIIKAFKCITYGEIDKCLRCPYDVYKECETFVYEDALDLINRQQAEIERLKAEQQNYKDFLLPIMEAREDIKAEAIKEFADKLKQNLSFGKYITAEQIDSLVKEMVERLAKEMVGADNGEG